MASNDARFDDHWLRDMQVAAQCEKVMQPAKKVLSEQDRAHAKATISEHTIQLLKESWGEYVAPKIGINDWDEMSKQLHQDHELWVCSNK